MAKPYRDGKYYRQRAQECRVVAEILSSINLRHTMLKIAADYERLAESADKVISDARDVDDLPPLR
jgi:hypothetical protein